MGHTFAPGLGGRSCGILFPSPLPLHAQGDTLPLWFRRLNQLQGGGPLLRLYSQTGFDIELSFASLLLADRHGLAPTRTLPAQQGIRTHA
jgi:hypothetical protein